MLHNSKLVRILNNPFVLDTMPMRRDLILTSTPPFFPQYYYTPSRTRFICPNSALHITLIISVSNVPEPSYQKSSSNKIKYRIRSQSGTIPNLSKRISALKSSYTFPPYLPSKLCFKLR